MSQAAPTPDAGDFPREFIVSLRFEKDWHYPARPRSIRARLLLKSLLRSHKARCTGLSDANGQPLPEVPEHLDPEEETLPRKEKRP